MKRALWICAAVTALSACGGTTTTPAAAPPAARVGGVAAQPAIPCPECVLSLHTGTSDLYDLSGELDGDYFSQQGVAELSEATLHLYDSNDYEIASTGATPS